KRGHVLLTAATDTLSRFHSVTLPPLSPQEGAELLLRRAGCLTPSPEDQEAAVILAGPEGLKGLPFALELAGAVMQAQNLASAEYLSLIRRERAAHRNGSAERPPAAFAFTLAFQHATRPSRPYPCGNRALADLLRL